MLFPYDVQRVVVLSILVTMFATLAGCASGRVVPIPGRDTAGLEPEDLVLIMDRAGFSRDEIIDLAPRLRNDLARHGSARIVKGDLTQAMFAISDGRVHVSSLRRGSFVYDPETRSYR